VHATAIPRRGAEHPLVPASPLPPPVTREGPCEGSCGARPFPRTLGAYCKSRCRPYARKGRSLCSAMPFASCWASRRLRCPGGLWRVRGGKWNARRHCQRPIVIAIRSSGMSGTERVPEPTDFRRISALRGPPPRGDAPLRPGHGEAVRSPFWRWPRAVPKGLPRSIGGASLASPWATRGRAVMDLGLAGKQVLITGRICSAASALLQKCP